MRFAKAAVAVGVVMLVLDLQCSDLPSAKFNPTAFHMQICST